MADTIPPYAKRGGPSAQPMVEGKWRDLRIFPSTTLTRGPPPHLSMGRNRIGPFSTQITQSGES
ncbi:hypothetical protein BV95_00805 [Sphingobium chlorophenolicum]|uniref:Uncharacterized protein n=1 Tax=Sphingobium chlorophenolicum TaxID=46429 RepID=A0A081RI70_SPHCR|nr:hypothetical protein BV95_00805 [Sphingobium chlorophenolicum]